MPYITPGAIHVPLRSALKLEAAMKRADMNGSEVAALANTSRQTISQLRREQRVMLNTDTAAAIEDALKVRRGTLFNFAAAGGGQA